jgi:hypothetical protein
MNRINLLSRGALREDMSSSSDMGLTRSRLSGMNASTTFNPFEFGRGQVPRRGVSSHYSFPPCGRSRSAPVSPPHTSFQAISENDALHHSMPNINFSHEMLPIEEEFGFGPVNHPSPNNLDHSLPNLNYTHQDASSNQSVPNLNYTHQDASLNHSVPNLNYTHQDASLNHSVPNLNYTHQDTSLNHSVPNLNYSHQAATLNHSVPNLNYTHQQDEPVHTATTDIEPIPFDQYSPQNRKRSLKKEIFSMNTAVTADTVASKETRARSAGTESDDLLTCLVKLTKTTLADDNPFEPIPLSNSSEHMIALDDSRFEEDGDMESDFEEDESVSIGPGELLGIDSEKSS